MAELNSLQKSAIQHIDGPLLVLAGAGTGKTSLLVHKIAWLLREGIEPCQIAAITSSCHAAHALRQRVAERISAQHLAWVLRAAYQSNVFAEFESSLPIVAVDGTMKKRLLLGNVSGHAHIKSGSLKDVRAIAGYVLDAKGRRDVVVCLVNDPHAERARAAQDALLEWAFERP